MDNTDNIAHNILKVAIKAAIRGGRKIYSYWDDLDQEQITQKSCWKDLVTIADKESEALVINTIRAEFPDHEIISEEGGGIIEPTSSSIINNDYQWAIDPLDGTTNFCHSYPYFCTSIGILYKGKPLVGVVYDPTRDELFTAIKGCGAYLNGRPLNVSKVNNIEQALIVTGFAYNQLSKPEDITYKLFAKYNKQSHGVRRDGAAALDLCYVASGRLDAFWEYGLKVWDIVAGSLIVEEAGGCITDPDQANNQDYNFDYFAGKLLASNTLLHSQITTDIINC